jgi:tetratricopeptide (TPR) repeat protein
VKSGSERNFPEAVKGGYSDDEIGSIYELGRIFLENGSLLQAEVIMHGLNEVCPDFGPAWLATAYINIQNKDFDNAIYAARQALRINPEFTEAMLYLVACLMTTNDYNAAGTFLGEVGERIEGGLVENPHVVRFYKAQLARYQSR